jgi:RNA polymerase primary sigma factor
MSKSIRREQNSIINYSSLLNKNSISYYLKEIDKIPLLTREEEIELAKKIEQGDKKAFEKLIVSNLRFVVSVAKKYQSSIFPLSDLISEGNIGLITAAKKYDHKKGYHFISYAIWWIKQSILKAISEKSRMIRLPMNRSNELMQIRRYIEEYSKVRGENPDTTNISEHLSISRNDVQKILGMSQSYSSIDEISSDDDNSLSYDILRDNTEDSPNDPDNVIVKNSLNSDIDNLLNILPEREKSIIEYRYGLNGKEPHSLSKIGEIFSITKERVRQIENWAINELKKSDESKYLYAYLN